MVRMVFSVGRLISTLGDIGGATRDNMGRVSTTFNPRSGAGSRRVNASSSVGKYFQTAELPAETILRIEMRRMEMGKEKSDKDREVKEKAR